MAQALLIAIVIGMVVAIILVLVEIIVFFMGMFALGCANLIVAADKVLGILSPATPMLSWAINGFVIFGLLYFAFQEAQRLNHPKAKAISLLILGIGLCAQIALAMGIVPPASLSIPSSLVNVSTRLTTQPIVEQRDSHEVLYVNAQELNVRSGPGTEYGVLTKLSQGKSVLALERSESQDQGLWVKIRTGALEGWVNHKHVTRRKPMAN